MQSARTPDPSTGRRPSSTGPIINIKKGQKLSFSILPYGDPKDEAVKRILPLPPSSATTRSENNDQNSVTPSKPLGRRFSASSSTSKDKKSLTDEKTEDSVASLPSPIPKSNTTTNTETMDKLLFDDTAMFSSPSSVTARRPHLLSPMTSDDTHEQNTQSSLTKKRRPSSSSSISKRRFSRTSSASKTNDDEVFPELVSSSISYLDTIIEKSTARATKLSMSAAAEYSSVMKVEKYGQAKQEAAVASLAALEGISDLLQEISQSSPSSSSSSSSSSWKECFSSASSTITKALVGLRNSVLATGEGIGNQLFDETSKTNNNINASTRHGDPRSSFDSAKIKSDTEERIKNYHRCLFSSFLHSKRSQKQTHQDSNESPTTNVRQYRELNPLHSNEAMVKEAIKKSLRIDEQASMNARLKNCDRMLEKIRNDKKHNLSKPSSNVSMIGVKQRIQMLKEARREEEQQQHLLKQQHQQRKIDDEVIDDDNLDIHDDHHHDGGGLEETTTISSQQQHHQEQEQHSSLMMMSMKFATMNPNLKSDNVWADAEDALHIMKMRFVFHLWRVVSRCEKQRRLNSHRVVRRLTEERNKVKILHTFLSFKRSQVVSKVLACKSLMKENKQLKYVIEEDDLRYQQAINQIEQTNMLYRKALSEIEKLREDGNEKERSPMIVDFRNPIRDMSTGNPIETGVIEFRVMKNEDSSPSSSISGNNIKKKSLSSSSSLNTLFHQIYPPFVDWGCPRQNEHARELLQSDVTERLSEKKGIAIPGFKLPSSFYEIRITEGDASNCFSTADADEKNGEQNIMTTIKSNKDDRKKKAKSSSSSSSSSVQHLADDFFATSFSSKRWDREMCSLINGILQKFGIEGSYSNNDDNNDQQQQNLLLWDLNEPLSRQIVQREILGTVIPSSLSSSTATTKENNNSSQASSSSQQKNSSKSNTTKKKEEENQQQQQYQKSTIGNRNVLFNASVSGFFSSSINNTNSDPSSSIRQNEDNYNSNMNQQTQQQQYLPPSIDAVTKSIQKARDSFATIHQQLYEATENFIGSSTESFIEEAKRRETLQEKERTNIIKNNDGDNDHHESTKTTAEIFSSRACAVAPVVLPPFIILRTNHLFIESPSDLILLPETTVRVFIIVFGKTAVVNCLREYANHNDYQSGNFTSILSILIEHLLQEGDAKKFFPSHHHHHQNSTSSSSVHESSSMQTRLLLGRELCSLIQYHLMKSTAEEEFEANALSNNPLMLRRALASSVRK